MVKSPVHWRGRGRIRFEEGIVHPLMKSNPAALLG
jgi:hypothetical protein